MNFFDNLEMLVEQAVGDAFGQEERLRQKRQTKVITRDNLHAQDKKENEEDVDEAETEDEDDDSKEEKSSEDAPQLSGDLEKVTKKLARRAAEKTRDTTIPGTATSKSLRNPTPEELQKPDFQTIAKNINLLRGGKSLKDKEVRKNLQIYIDNLDVQEKKEVLIYLNSLAQVMAGVKAPSDVASSPHDVGTSTPPVSKPKKAVVKKEKSKDSSSPSGAIVVGAS